MTLISIAEKTWWLSDGKGKQWKMVATIKVRVTVYAKGRDTAKRVEVDVASC